MDAYGHIWQYFPGDKVVSRPNDQLCGEVLSEHRWHFLGLFEHYSTGAIASTASYMVGCVAALALYDKYSDANLVILVVLLLFPTVTFAYLTVRTRLDATNVEVREDGIEWTDGTGHHAEKWENVCEVQNHEVYGVGEDDVSLTIVFEDEVRMKASLMLLGYKRLRQTVLQTVTSHLLAMKLKELEDGGAVFGPIRVFGNGLEYGGDYKSYDADFIEWEELNQWRIVNGHFTVQSRRGRIVIQIPHTEIPNWYPFLLLVEHIWQKPLPPTRWVWED